MLYSLAVPGGYAKQDVDAAVGRASTIGSSPTMLGAAPPPNPLLLRYASKDGSEVLSLAVRKAAELRPTFMQVNSLEQFGAPEEAAPLLVPPRARVVSARATERSATIAGKSGPEDITRTYYEYEFVAGGFHGALTACARQGQVYVLAGTAPDAAWASGGAARFAGALESFRVM